MFEQGTAERVGRPLPHRPAPNGRIPTVTGPAGCSTGSELVVVRPFGSVRRRAAASGPSVPPPLRTLVPSLAAYGSPCCVVREVAVTTTTDGGAVERSPGSLCGSGRCSQRGPHHEERTGRQSITSQRRMSPIGGRVELGATRHRCGVAGSGTIRGWGHGGGGPRTVRSASAARAGRSRGARPGCGR
jgi:hypothetical protein